MSAHSVRAWRESGYVEGQNVAIEYRWAEAEHDRLPAMAADLVHRQVTVIAATSTPAALAAKAATTTIPIVFETAGDPVQLGLVASLNRPGGNVTGVTQLNVETVPKRLELLHELIPTASVMALLVNPTDPLAETEVRALQRSPDPRAGAPCPECQHRTDFDAVFANLIQLRAGGLVIGAMRFSPPGSNSSPHWRSATRCPRSTKSASSSRPAAWELRTAYTDAYRLAGVYAGRILKGEKPRDLPVQQPTKFELVINLKTAKALGLTVPLPLLGRADEVIE